MVVGRTCTQLVATGISSDYLQAYHRTDSQRKLLTETLSRVREIVHEHAGPHCIVEDISMHTYSSEIHNGPFEFAIVVSSLFAYIAVPFADPNK